MTESEEFYSDIQVVIDWIDKYDWLIIAGDLNTRVSSLSIDNVEDKYSEIILNTNEELLIDLCLQNKFKLTLKGDEVQSLTTS